MHSTEIITEFVLQLINKRLFPLQIFQECSISEKSYYVELTHKSQYSFPAPNLAADVHNSNFHFVLISN